MSESSRPASGRAVEDVPAPLLDKQRAYVRNRERLRQAIYAADKAGEPCACGTEPDQVCLLHRGLIDHRRHVRPS